MQRGEVYRIQLDLPDRISGTGTTQRVKYVLILQDDAAYAAAPDVALVIASSKRTANLPRPFEVEVGSAEGFSHATLIDCRWVYTLPKTAIAGPSFTTLPPAVMQKVDRALVVGLQMI